VIRSQHERQRQGGGRIALLTLAALVAFASNSLLCRIALRDGSIDPATFSTVRLASGAVVLLALLAARGQGLRALEGSWLSAGVLFLYAVPFSFAYTGLSAGTGALILFGSVQATMMIVAVASGDRPHALQWLGLALAIAGLVYLVLPGLESPPLASAALMALAGLAWGVYTLRGRGAHDPLAQTAGNFVRCVPLVLAVSLLALRGMHAEGRGVVLAVASGAAASALGYVIWYAALRGLTTTRAAVVQLAVPALTALGGVLFLAETVSMRLVVASALILGGIALALVARDRLAHRPAAPATP
jgi:drug/metabolite transporter (DMT)-like permease